MLRIRRSDAARQERLDKKLYKAALKGCIDDVKQALDDGAKLLSYGQLGTPLHAAVTKGHLSVALLLLDSGAPTNLMGDTNYTPLHIACRHGHSAIVSAIINYNTDLNIRSKFEQRTPLHIAARRNAVAIAELLISKKATVDSRDLYGNTPLHIACRGGSALFAELLLNNGANPDIYDNDGWSALHFAAHEGYTEVIELLIKKKAAIDQQNKYGRTPLHWACAGQHIPAVETLLSFGASTLIKDRQGKFAVNTTNDNVIKRIIKLYENSLPTDGDSAGVTTLDLHLTLKPFIRSLSRVESHDSRVTEHDEIDSKSVYLSMPTSPDVSNCLKTMFGSDIIDLIDECFGQSVDIAQLERRQSCHKYKQFLMAVASLLLDLSGHINTLYSTVSAGLQNKSQIQIIEILKIIFGKIQTIEDNLGGFQREICAAGRALTLSIKETTDSCTDCVLENENRPNLFTLQDKVNHFTQAQILDDMASLIAKHKDMWRKLLPKLQPDLSDKNTKELEKRIETCSKDETKRVSTMLYIWHIPKDLKDSEKDIDSDELYNALSDFDAGGHITKEIKKILEKYDNEEPAIQLVDLNAKASSVFKSKNVTFENESVTDTDSTVC